MAEAARDLRGVQVQLFRGGLVCKALRLLESNNEEEQDLLGAEAATNGRRGARLEGPGRDAVHPHPVRPPVRVVYLGRSTCHAISGRRD